MNAITTPGNPLEDFKARVIDKLKTDIGALMPDEVMAGLVQQAVKETFFDKTRVPNPNQSYGQPTLIDQPSWFMSEIKSQVEPILKHRIAEYVSSNRDVIDQTISAALERDKLIFISAGVIGDTVRQGMTGAVMDFMQQARSAGLIRW